MARYILAIDPGNIESAFVIIDAETLRPLHFGKMENEAVLQRSAYFVGLLYQLAIANAEPFSCELAIEMIASYGMPVGAEVFDTCVWIGEFKRAFSYNQLITGCALVYRREEKLTICGSPKANDANIRQALVDRFAKGRPNNGKGTKKNPGWFYQFRADIWQAYAVAVTYAERERRNE